MQRSFEVRKINEFTGHGGGIYGLYISPISGKVYTGASDGYVVEWDLNKPDEGRLIGRLDQAVYSIYLIESLQQLWVGTANGHIHVLDLGTKSEIKNLVSHQKGVFDLKELHGKIYAAGGDGHVSVWDTEKLTLISIKKFSDKSVRTIAISAEKLLLAIGISDFSIVLLDAHLAVFDQVPNAHSNSVFSLAFNEDGSILLSGGRDALLKIWQLGSELELVKEIPARNYHIHCLAMQKEGTYFLSSSMDKTIKLWDSKSFELLKVIDKARNESHINSINKIAWLNSQQFVSISDDKKMMHWELKVNS